MSTANCYAQNKNELGGLTNYEPTLIGYTFDNRGDQFMDFKISLKYPILHTDEPAPAIKGWFPHFYFAFTMRAGQYIGTRDSAPVIAKRFNPELYGRYWIERDSTKPDNTIDILIGHESNGQSIETEEQYLVKRKELVEVEDDADDANDFISRGWDYLGIRWTREWNGLKEQNRYKLYLTLRYFLDNGFLQTDAEDYNEFENDPKGKERNDVAGLDVKIKLKQDFLGGIFSDRKNFFQYTTGIERPLQYSTFRFEFSLTGKGSNLPIMAWVEHGYNSDLTDYFRSVTSYGVALELFSR